MDTRMLNPTTVLHQRINLLIFRTSTHQSPCFFKRPPPLSLSLQILSLVMTHLALVTQALCELMSLMSVLAVFTGIHCVGFSPKAGSTLPCVTACSRHSRCRQWYHFLVSWWEAASDGGLGCARSDLEHTDPLRTPHPPLPLPALYYCSTSCPFDSNWAWWT